MRRPHGLSVLAAVLVTPLFVALPSSTGASVVAGEAVVTSERAVGLLPASAPAVGDGEVVTRSEAALARVQAAEQGAAVAARTVLQVTAAQAVPQDVAVVGVTWQRGSGRSLVVQYRVRSAGDWGAWQGVDVEATTDAAALAGGRAGSDPIVVTGASHVQVRVLGLATDTPAAAQLTIVDPGEGPADAHAGRVAPGAAVAAGVVAPRVYSRAEWGANESIRRGSPSYGVVKAAIVHHTAGTNNYRADQVPAILRGIYTFHVKGRGWSDIGYNALVDKWGRVWEGRAGGMDRAVVGAHTLGYNSWTTGISVMGDYGVAPAPAAAVTAVSRVIGWKSRLHGFSPTSRTVLGNRTLPTVMGHRDANSTSCPGVNLYAALPAIRRQSSANAATPASPPPLPRDLDGLGGSTVLARGSAGQLLAYQARLDGTLSPARSAGRGWSGVDTIALGDWDGDRDIDALVRVIPTGELRIYPSDGRGGLGASRLVARGWATRRTVMSPGDVTGDGRPDLLSVATSGRLLLNAGGPGATLRAPLDVGRGWSGIRQLVGVGDWTRDGKPDLIAVATTGEGRLYPGIGGGRWGRAISLGRGWGSYLRLVGIMNGPGRSGILAATATGALSWGVAGRANSVVWRRLPASLKGVNLYSG